MRQLLVTAGLLLPLGLDTLALATALGVAGLGQRERLRVALVFAIFEAGMPIIGILAGRFVGALIGAWAGWLAIAVVLVAGLLLLRPGKDEEAEAHRLQLLSQARGAAILTLGISISLDELTVGLSAGLLGLSIALTVIWVAIQALIVTQLGLRIGARVGEQLRERSELAAGVALVGVALLLLALKVFGI